jgi:hypothetical protein
MISGPISWYEFNYKGVSPTSGGRQPNVVNPTSGGQQPNNVKITLFGDLHEDRQTDCEDQKYTCVDVGNSTVKQSSCYSIAAYLDKLADYNNKAGIPTDIYVEMAFLPSDRDYSRGKFRPTAKAGHLNSVISTLANCMAKTKIKCPYTPHVRVHYVDIRQLFPKILPGKVEQLARDTRAYLDYAKINIYNEPLDKIILIMREIMKADKITLKNWNLYWAMLFGEKDYNATVQLLADKYGNTHVQKFYKHVLLTSKSVTSVRDGKRMHKIAVQMLALQKQGKTELIRDIKNFIQQSMLYRTRKINKITADLTNSLEKAAKDSNKLANLLEVKYTISLYQHAWVQLYSLTLDAYFLARMFKYIDNNSPNDSKQIVIYAGASHIESYASFFKSTLLLRPTREIVNQDQSRCISRFVS